MSRPDSWFRFYNTAVDNPKVQRLPDALFKAWVNLLCVASRNGGKLPALADAAFALRVRASVAEGWLKALEARRLFDRAADGTLTPHDWNVLQYKSDLSTERVQRFRARRREQGETVSEAAPEQSPDSRAEESESDSVAGERKSEEGFAAFWQAYPQKVGRKAALLAWTEAEDRPALAVMLAAVATYTRGKPVDRAWCNPARWLAEGRWNDAPAGTAGEDAHTGARTAGQWRWGAKLYAEKKYWPPSFGPAPGNASCECPHAILAEFGLTASKPKETP